MTGYLVRRLLLVLPTLVGVVVLLFTLLEVLPGDPAAVYLGENATPDAVAALRQELGLDRPVLARLWSYFSGVVRGDLGDSWFRRESVAIIVAERLPATVELASVAFFIAVTAGIVLGACAAVYRRGVFEFLAISFAELGVSVPVFWLGILLMAWFSVDLGWFPAVGRGASLTNALLSADATRVADALRHLFLPAMTLAVHHAAVISRLVRSSMLEALSQDYVRAARARGLGTVRVGITYALTNALRPVVSVLGVRFGALLGGAVLTEKIFGWPGLGELAVTAVSERDLPLVQGIVFVFALIFVLLNVVVDLVHASLDPTIRLGAPRSHA